MKYIILGVMLLCMNHVTAQDKVRLKEKFDFDWKFILDDKKEYAQKSFIDTHWENIQVPHDWSIKLKFDKSVGGASAFIPGGIGWYRKSFTVPTSYQDKKVSILFDGIMHQSDVYINGHHLGFHPYGYSSIEYDLTPYLKFYEENVIAVRVDRTGKSARWYTGSGIYRHVWLQVVNPIHVSTYGTYITTPSVSIEKADVKIVTTLKNDNVKEQNVSVSHRVLNTSGKEIAKSKVGKIILNRNDSTNIEQSFSLSKPELWSIETPVLYTMETTVKVGNKVVDVYATPFGVRTIKFDKDKGFFLNGKHIKLKGLCLHQDAGSMGVAVPDKVDERRLKILKEYGCNAIRCAHNQPTPEFLDMCDRMGFVVIDEAFDKWRSGYYEKHYDEWWKKDLGNMIIRDRNHPSIILWSYGNEVAEACWDDLSVTVPRAKMMQEFVQKLEPTRPATMAVQNKHKTEFAGVAEVIGYNYLEARMLSEKKEYSERICLVSEELPYFSGEEGNFRSYTPYNPWNIVAENDFIAGGFIWSGVDYLGEAVWPSKGWPNGLFDVCMNEKPRAIYHRAMWNDKPVVGLSVIDASLDLDPGRDLWQWLRMASHWNFPDSYIGQIMELRTTTNCESVELFYNDKSMGRQKTADFTNNTIIWYLPYNPGKLEAKGYNGDKEVASYSIVTTKATSKAVIIPDRTILRADGEDICHIAIHLEDEDGNLVQTDDRKLTVTVDGEGKFLALDNGDVRRLKHDRFWTKELDTYFGKALIVVQSTRKAGKMKINIQMEGRNEPYVVEIVSR